MEEGGVPDVSKTFISAALFDQEPSGPVWISSGSHLPLMYHSCTPLPPHVRDVFTVPPEPWRSHNNYISSVFNIGGGYRGIGAALSRSGAHRGIGA